MHTARRAENTDSGSQFTGCVTLNRLIRLSEALFTYLQEEIVLIECAYAASLK